jgi:hypothetical protein
VDNFLDKSCSFVILKKDSSNGGLNKPKNSMKFPNKKEALKVSGVPQSDTVTAKGPGVPKNPFFYSIEKSVR